MMKNGALAINEPDIVAFLEKSHAVEKSDVLQFMMRLAGSKIKSKLVSGVFSFTDQYHGMADLALAISPEQGLFAYQMVRLARPKRIVEFGTSFGVSTVYLASALKDNGAGKVIGSEFVKTKVNEAKENLKRLGLLKWTDIRYGDARVTLADPGGPVDMILLDGSKDMYLEIIKILLPYLRPGGIVLADNVTSPIIRKTLLEYVEFMQNRDNGFVSMTLPFKDGFEFSIKL
jgi:predicted O-methyltransferase YrrM